MSNDNLDFGLEKFLIFKIQFIKNFMLYSSTDLVSSTCGLYLIQKLRGIVEAVTILTKHNKTQYEFIFTNLSAENYQLYSTILNVHRWVGLT